MRTTLAALATLLIGLVVVGCGGGSSDSDPGSGSPANGARSTSAKAPPSVTVAFPAKWASLDPNASTNTHSQNVLHLIGGNLSELRGEKVVPGLAESTSTSTDELTWTFKLRPSLRFSDGSPLTSADVRATLDRAMTDKANAFAGYVEPIESVQAPDPSTVVVKLKDPYPSLPSILSLPALMILPEAVAKKPDKRFFRSPISAGPYKLTDVAGSGESTFAINEHYWGPKPTVPTVKFAIVEDFNARFAQLRSGQIDISIDFPPSLRPQLEKASGIDSSFIPLYGFSSLDMWNGKPPLDDVKVRKALSFAVDRKQINEVIWGGELDMYAGFWPPTMDGYDSSVSIERNTDEAKRLLAGTACASGCKLKLSYATAYSFADQAAAIIKSNLADIGVEVNLSKVDLGTWSEQHNTGNYQLAIGGLVSSLNVPDPMLSYAFPQPEGGGFNANWSDWKSKRAADAAVAAVRASGEERAAALKALDDVFVEEMPYAPLAPYSLLVGQRVPKSVVSFSPSSLVEIGRQGGAS